MINTVLNIYLDRGDRAKLTTNYDLNTTHISSSRFEKAHLCFDEAHAMVDALLQSDSQARPCEVFKPQKRSHPEDEGEEVPFTSKAKVIRNIYLHRGIGGPGVSWPQQVLETHFILIMDALLQAVEVQ